jgi:hypothetical protein
MACCVVGSIMRSGLVRLVLPYSSGFSDTPRFFGWSLDSTRKEIVGSGRCRCRRKTCWYRRWTRSIRSGRLLPGGSGLTFMGSTPFLPIRAVRTAAPRGCAMYGRAEARRKRGTWTYPSHRTSGRHQVLILPAEGAWALNVTHRRPLFRKMTVPRGARPILFKRMSCQS